MRDIFGKTALASLLFAAGLALCACGGSPPREDPTWRARERVPSLATHWWWEPVERACEEDDDCRTGESCRNMRLGTCPGCPRGEDARICVGPEGQNRQARGQGSR